jgi:uncharacterized membrane protein
MAVAMNFNKLKHEVAAWVDEKIISASQAEQILARYSATVPAYKRMSFWLQCLAATLAGFALLLVISKNWQHLSWFAQSSITIAPLIFAQLWAIWQERKDNHLGAELGWFLASLALGANIMIQAQIFTSARITRTACFSGFWVFCRYSSFAAATSTTCSQRFCFLFTS